MGSSESKPPPPPPPPRQIPTVTPPTIPVRSDLSLSIATASACLECPPGSCENADPCRLAVAPNKSASSVKIYRNRKAVDVRTGQCISLSSDFVQIGKTITLREFVLNLRQGKYSTISSQGGCVDVEASPDQFNTLMRLGDNIETNSATFNSKITPNITHVRTRDIASGTYSYMSEDKLTIVPNVPFEMSYNGTVFSITKMALFHPSPFRIENVQHDAVLTLNDPIDNPPFVVMIPLVSSSSTTPSTTFFSRIGSGFSKVVLPNQDGTEETVATGSDWSISKLFTMMTDGVSIVDPFYTWTGVQGIGGVGKGNVGRYIMMEKPAFISSGDLSTLRILPAINPLFAVPYMSDPVSYRKQVCCGASGTSPSRERFTVKESFLQPLDIFAVVVSSIFFLLGTLLALYLSQQPWVANPIRDVTISFGNFFSKQFDKLYGGVSIPGLGGLNLKDLQSGNIQGLGDLKNLSTSAQQTGDVPPALQNLASNVGATPPPSSSPPPNQL